MSLRSPFLRRVQRTLLGRCVYPISPGVQPSHTGFIGSAESKGNRKSTNIDCCSGSGPSSARCGSSHLAGRAVRWNLNFATTFLIVLLTLMPVASQAQTPSALIGDLKVEGFVDSNVVGQAQAYQVTAGTSGTVSSITFYVDASNASTQIFLGIYKNYWGHPTGLLTQGSTTLLKAGAWNTIAVLPVSVTAGTRYWMAILGVKGGRPAFRDGTSGVCHSEGSAQTSLTALPATWTTGPIWGQCPLSAYGSPVSSGTAVGTLSASPASLGFGNVTVGTSGSQTVSLTNTGNAGLTLSSASIAGNGFSLSGLTLPLSLASGQSASFSVRFAPTVTGSVTGSLSMVSNANNSPATVSLSGTGTTGSLSASPASMSFGNIAVGASSTQRLTLTDTGTASVTISQASVTGAGFSLSGLTLPLTLAAGQTTSFSVAFAPKATGTVAGSISVASSSPNSPTVVSLSGNGQGLTLAVSPTSTSFGNVIVGSSNTLPVSLKNTSLGSITVSQAAATGAGFTISGLTLPLTLAAGQNASFSVTFAPQVTGSVAGNVSIASNAMNSPTNEPLSATGVNSHSVSLAWTASSSNNVVGYNLYAASVAGGPYTKLNSSPVSATSYTDKTVVAGEACYYVATAVDSNNVESGYSGEVRAVVPVP